jgi:diguanylate cyclase (GGDEF)-like protein
MTSQHRMFPAFTVIAIAAGAVALSTGSQGWEQAGRHPAIVISLGFLLLVTELQPVTVLHRRENVAVATSTAFTFALLLFAGIGPALVAQLAASLVADLLHRKSVLKIVFNMAQYAISIALAGEVLLLMGGSSPLSDGRVQLNEVAQVAATAFSLFLANNLLVWGVVSLATTSSFRQRVNDELAFQLATGVVLMGLAPVVVLVALGSLAMLPALLIPVGAVYLTARSSVSHAHNALHDGLTGLANRTGFQAEVTATLDEPGRMRRPLAVLLVDLDRFKEINDTLGHHTGDVLLRQIGPRLATAGADITLVARMGGDEFAVLLADVEGADHALAVAQKLVRALEEPFVLDDGLLLEVEASIGVAVTPEHGGDVDLLLQHADVAMYLAKVARTGAELYSPERDKNSRRRLTLLGQLRTAIANEELTLFYQPKLDLSTQQFSGVEALVRWVHPEHGLLPPSDFLPLAERSGLIKPLTHFVLRQAIAQAKQWHRDGLPLRVAVNLSARTFLDHDLPRTISVLLAEAGMDPIWLELEITETELMTDPDRGARVLARLHDMGIRLTIDDFGTGHSSLAYLLGLPVDEIKIDRCFVAAMAGDADSADDIIVRSTIDLARNLGLEVTAEGVETVEQLDRLTILGARYLQGFYLSRPLPADEITPLLAATSALNRTPARTLDPRVTPC